MCRGRKSVELFAKRLAQVMPWATCIREDSMKQNRIMWEFSPLGWGSANEKWISGQNCNIHPKWSASQMYIIIKSWESEGKSNPKRGQNVKEGFQQFLQSSQSASVKISIPSHCFKTWMNIIWISYSSQTWMKLDCENCFKTWEWTKFENICADFLLSLCESLKIKISNKKFTNLYLLQDWKDL